MNVTGMRVAMLGNDYRFGFAPLAGDAEQPSASQAVVDDPKVDQTALWTAGIDTTGKVLETLIETRYGRKSGQTAGGVNVNVTAPTVQKKWYEDPATLTIAGVGAVVGLVVLSTAMKKSRRRR